ncbi:MAG TPA: hypothetical protein VIJ49_11350 [Aestuariivirga sp.]
MATRTITVFYAWQSDRPQEINRTFIRKALDAAAKRLTEDQSIDAKVVIDADTEGVVGTPHVTETILEKIRAADIFAPDLTFVAETDGGKLIPNPNVMTEYGYALRELGFEAMMPVMNTYFGPPEKLPFDLGHFRHPTQYELLPDAPDGVRRALRDKLSATFEDILRLMIRHALAKMRKDNPFIPQATKRQPAFFFQPQEVLANLGDPGEQELRFKRGRAIYMRLYPSFADQLFIGNTGAKRAAKRLMPLQRVLHSPSAQNEWGAINVVPHGDGITSFTQVFESGELWSVSERPFGKGERPFLGSIASEKDFTRSLENYLMVYRDELKLRPPFTIEFGATGLKGHYLHVPSIEVPSSGEYAGPMRKDDIMYKTELTGFEWIEWQSALREFLIRLYDHAGRERSQVLTDQLVAAHELVSL